MCNRQACPAALSSIEVTVRDAVTNALVINSTVDASHVDIAYEVIAKTDNQGVARIMVTTAGMYTITVTNTGYIVSTGRAWVGQDYGSLTRTTITTSQVLPAGSVRMIMNWNENPLDMDLHAFQVNTNDKTDTCNIYYDNRTGCQGVGLDLDNTQGGLNGAETITFSSISTNSHYTYLVFVDDFTNKGSSLQESEAKLTVTDGTKTITVDMPNVAWDGSSRYWFVGCMVIEEDQGWKFMEEDMLTVANPSTDQPFFCHDLVAPTQPPPPPFYPGAEVTVSVKNGIDNTVVTGATATLSLRTMRPAARGLGRQVVLSQVGRATSDSQGLISFPITSSGDYVVEVTCDGYTVDETNFTVSCNANDGTGCTPTRLVSLSPVMPRGDLRIIMNWDGLPKDLDLWSIQIDTSTQATCGTYWNNTAGCSGVRLDWDNTLGGDKGPETITYSGFEAASQNIYMIYIDDYSRRPEQFKVSDARLTITDGVQTVKVKICPSSFNNERYWLAGCIRSTEGGFEWKNVETFERASPRWAKQLHCMQVFGLGSGLGAQGSGFSAYGSGSGFFSQSLGQGSGFSSSWSQGSGFSSSWSLGSGVSSWIYGQASESSGQGSGFFGRK